MASSRRTRRRRQQQSFRRHQLRLESLEKRYALNAAPTDIVLNAPPLPEGPPAERTVGMVLTTDPDVSPGGTFYYSLVAGPGDQDNALFSFNEASHDYWLYTNDQVDFDYESRSEYFVRVRSEDEGGLSVEKALTVQIGDVDEGPGFLSTSKDYWLKFDSTNQQPTGPVGVTVQELLGLGTATESSQQGIAVIGLGVPAENAWYSLNDGIEWLQMPAVNEASALVLHAEENTRIYVAGSATNAEDVADGLVIKQWNRSGEAGNGSIGIDTTKASVVLDDLQVNNPRGLTLTNDGQFLFVSDLERGVEVFAANVDGNYQKVFSANGFGRGNRVVLSPDEQVLYLIDHANVDGLRSLDVSDPHNPVLLDSLPTSSNPVYNNLAITGDGTTLYLADGTAGIRIIDSTDPSNLTDIGVYHPSLADPIDICLSPSGNLAFISTFYGLEIVDIQDRSSLTQVGAFQTWNNYLDVKISSDGNLAFVQGWLDLLIINVSDPSNPQLVDSIHTHGHSHHFELSTDENTAFIADNVGGIIVVDATNPADLKWSRYIDPETTAKTEEVLLHPDGTTAFTLAINEPAVRRINLYAEPQSFSSATIDIRMTNNAPPTIDPLQQYEIAEDSGQQVVSLTGISSGIGESQPIRVTATSSHPELIPNPIVTYLSPDATGSLAFTPVPNQHGTATITVTVDDGGLDNDLGNY
jgi:hypothetical protein